jgi:hypothetical protein
MRGEEDKECAASSSSSSPSSLSPPPTRLLRAVTNSVFRPRTALKRARRPTAALLFPLELMPVMAAASVPSSRPICFCDGRPLGFTWLLLLPHAHDDGYAPTCAVQCCEALIWRGFVAMMRARCVMGWWADGLMGRWAAEGAGCTCAVRLLLSAHDSVGAYADVRCFLLCVLCACAHVCCCMRRCAAAVTVTVLLFCPTSPASASHQSPPLQL